MARNEYPIASRFRQKLGNSAHCGGFVVGLSLGVSRLTASLTAPKAFCVVAAPEGWQ